MAKIQHCSNVPTEQIKKSFCVHLVTGSLPTGSATITPKLPTPDSLDFIRNNSAQCDNTGVLPSNYSALPHNTGVSKIEFENFDSRDLFHLRDISGLINKESNVKYCGKTFIKGIPDITVKQSGKTRYFHGVIRCGSVWICPVCSFRLQKRRQGEISSYIEEQEEMKRNMFFLTLTVRHYKKDTLDTVFKKVKNAWNKLGKSKKHKRLFRSLEYIATIEITFTFDKNGWHPHYHILLTETVNEDISEMIKEFINDWCIETESTKENQIFKKVSSISLGDYIAKWDIASELSQSIRKTQSVTYWKMLKEPDKYKKQISEYAATTKGKRTLQKSKGIKLKTDKEIFEEEGKSDNDLLEIDRETYKTVIKPKRIYKTVLENAHHPEKIQDILDDPKVILNLSGKIPRIEYKSKTPLLSREVNDGVADLERRLLKTKQFYEKEFPELIQASGSPGTGSPRSCRQKKRPVLPGAF